MIVLPALLALFVSFGFLFFVMKKLDILPQKSVPAISLPGTISSSPAEQFDAYIELVNAEDYQGIYRLISKESRRAVTEEKFIQRYENTYGRMHVSEVTAEYSEDKSDGDQLVYTMRMNSCAGEISFDNTVSFTREEGNYRLNWSDGVIFPDLEEDSRIVLSATSAERGTITDRNGVILAGNVEAAIVGLVPGKMDSTSVRLLAAALGTTEAGIQKKLSAAWVTDDSFVPIRTIGRANDATLYWLRQDSTTNYVAENSVLSIPGVKLQSSMIRSYPLGAVTAHLIGYVQGISAEELEKDTEGVYNSSSIVGRSGLESTYESRLRGTSGYRASIVSEAGETLKVLGVSNPEKGEDIVLTIDSRLQQMLYDQYKEDCSATVAMNPYNGEVMALVSTPSYDTNLMIFGVSEEVWNGWNEDEKKPLMNRFRSAFVPGSSMKTITGLIGMTRGLLDPKKDLQSTRSWQADSSWGSYYVTTKHLSAPANLTNAMILSDNVYFAKAALQIGYNAMEGGWKDAGFGESVPFPITMTASSYANSEHISSDILLADSGYGQGEMLVNPLHMACMYSAMVNSGSMIQPQLETGAEKAYWKTNVFSSDACDIMANALRLVVKSKYGTAHDAYNWRLPIAGKTGTAELKLSQDDEDGSEIGWFTSYTMERSTSDSLMLCTMVEDVKDEGGSAYVVKGSRTIYENWNNLPEDEDE